MFGRKKEKKQQQYTEVKALYFGEPVYETIRIVVEPEQKSMELFFQQGSYRLSIDRLSVMYHPELCTSFLAKGKRCFGDDWPQMDTLLRAEKNRREDSSLMILLTSDVFMQMADLTSSLRRLLPEKSYQRTDL